MIADFVQLAVFFELFDESVGLLFQLRLLFVHAKGVFLVRQCNVDHLDLLGLGGLCGALVILAAVRGASGERRSHKQDSQHQGNDFVKLLHCFVPILSKNCRTDTYKYTVYRGSL